MADQKKQPAKRRPVQKLPERTADEIAKAGAFVVAETAVSNHHKTRFQQGLRLVKETQLPRADWPWQKGQWFCYYKDHASGEDKMKTGKTQIEAMTGVVGSCYCDEMGELDGVSASRCAVVM